MREVYRILKPKYGWAQIMETAYPHCISDNDSLPKDAALSMVLPTATSNDFYQLFEYVDEYFRKGQGIMMHGEKIEQLMIDARFVDVNVRKVKIELGDWGPGRPQHMLSHCRSPKARSSTNLSKGVGSRFERSCRAIE